MRICHIINNLYIGGAELMLCRLLASIGQTQHKHSVISLIDVGPVGAQIERLGVPVTAIGMKRGKLSISAFLRLANALKDARADLVQTWLYHADLLGALAMKYSRIRAPLIWNIRHSGLQKGVDSRTTFWTKHMCAAMSQQTPARIVVNSQVGKTIHAEEGYADQSMEVIPNGYDLNTLKPSAFLRQRLRNELQISADVPLVGIVGRYHPQKDHCTFIEAADHLAKLIPDVRFLMCGEGLTWDNAKLRGELEKRNLSERFRLIGPRHDVQSVHASVDVSVSSSLCGEGFSNVLAESMACETPCVATNIGDAALIVGDAGKIVPPSDPVAMAQVVAELLRLPQRQRLQLGKAARRRIAENFSIQRIAQRYLKLWESVMNSQHPAALRNAA
ncbi:MAG: glycosyltransferase [Planctomycetota bacterium]